jgi:predicted dinucleotide-binding enzyme
MKIVVIGTGDMGGAIAHALARRTAHAISVRGSRPNSVSEQAVIAANAQRITAATEENIAAADALFIVIPWDAIDAATSPLVNYAGLVVSVIVPWSDEGDGDPRTTLTSAAELLAARMPGARVACAFTSISARVMRDPGRGRKPSVVVCADNDDARNAVLGLAAELGFAPVGGGALRAARFAEGLGLLWASLAYDAGYGERVTYDIFVA